MFNLYFTDWGTDGLPIPNGQLLLDSLTRQGRVDHINNSVVGKPYFYTSNFEQMCKIAGYKYTYTNQFVDNFIFLICYELDPPIWDLVVPLSDILTIDIINAINTKGYLIFSDNEGWLHMPDILRKQAISLGVLPDKIIYITSDPTSNSVRDVFWDYNEEGSFYRTIESLKYSDLRAITKTTPTKLFTSLTGTSNPSKIEFLNKIINNNLFNDGNISLIRLKDKYKKLVNKELLSMYPIILDCSTDHYSHFTNTITIYASSYISIVHSSDPIYEPLLPTIVVSNNDLYSAVASKRPFLTVNYSVHKLDYVKLLGYKTFDKWFDEDYDLIENKEHRVDAVIKLLMSLKHVDLNNLLVDMEDTLEYNFNHFFRKTNRNSHLAVKKLKELIYVN